MVQRRKHRGDGAAASDDAALRQADLSHLHLQDMTPPQRAELRRRYDDFVRHFGRDGMAPSRYPEPRKPRSRKWTPGAKR
ncbi:MAG TPA: hypothetical protein VEI03_11375 [Stellaceae bacterium]|nr:hypothetical protein [Stellaceae bacterium]